MTDPTAEAETKDFRSELQKQEQREAKAFAMLSKAARIAKMLDDLHERAAHQVKHNAPLPPSFLQELQAIRALLN
jgi:hypothetical protein